MLGFENLRNPGQAIDPSDLSGKTKAIRATLTQHYIDKVREYHEAITQEIFPIFISNIKQIGDRLLKLMQSKYRPALEIVMAHEVEGEFASRKQEVEERSRRFRDTIEQIEQLSAEMEAAVARDE